MDAIDEPAQIAHRAHTVCRSEGEHSQAASNQQGQVATPDQTREGRRHPHLDAVVGARLDDEMEEADGEVADIAVGARQAGDALGCEAKDQVRIARSTGLQQRLSTLALQVPHGFGLRREIDIAGGTVFEITRRITPDRMAAEQLGELVDRGPFVSRSDLGHGAKPMHGTCRRESLRRPTAEHPRPGMTQYAPLRGTGAHWCPGPRERASPGRCAAARRNRMRSQLAVFVAVLALMSVLIGKWGAFD